MTWNTSIFQVTKAVVFCLWLSQLRHATLSLFNTVGFLFENKQIVWGQKYGKFKISTWKKNRCHFAWGKKRQQIQSHAINSPTFCRWLDGLWKQKPLIGPASPKNPQAHLVRLLGGIPKKTWVKLSKLSKSLQNWVDEFIPLDVFWLTHLPATLRS